MAKVVWRSWKPEAVIAASMAEVAGNGELVGEFLEAEARRRLDAIRRPDNKKAVAWRRFLSRYVLTNVVTVSADEVVITVGMKRSGAKGGNTRGFYVEIGSARAPAHPYLRPAVFGNGPTIVSLLGGGG